MNTLGGKVKLALILASIFFSLVAEGSQENDPCLNNCTLSFSSGSGFSSVCRCGKPLTLPIAYRYSTLSEAERRKVDMSLRFRFPKVQGGDFERIRSDSCRRGLELGSPLWGKERLLSQSKVANQSLCQCVKTMVHFPVNKECKINGTAERQCNFTYDINTVKMRPALVLRKPTLFDYQSCLARRQNYREPASCHGSTSCQSEKPSCKKGEELVNIADPGACCPVFQCQKEGEA